jgi:mono/diheme cytochrome c family protein
MCFWRQAVLLAVLAASAIRPAAKEGACAGEDFDRNADARIYIGFIRYHAVCNHCHGPDGAGSMVAPPLIERLPEIGDFRCIVRDGTSSATSVMKGFGGDPNVAPYIDDIYAYLRARASGTLGRGRPDPVAERR